jgi:succinoglycan biosynthesis protein ExoA
MRLLLNPQRLQAACNLALRASGGAELFMRCDAHAYYPPGFIARAVRLLDQHRADGVAYSDRPLAGGAARNAFQCGVGFAQNNWLGVGQSRYRLGTFSGWVDHGKHGCFRRDLLLAAGGYDETFAVNEDSELSYRLVQRGAHLWLDQELWVGYVPRSRPGALARQYFLYGQGRVQNLRKHARPPSLRQWAPAALVQGQAAALGAALWRPETLLLPGMYTAALAGIACAGVRQRKRWAVLWSAPAMAIMHFAFGAGFLARLIQPVVQPARSRSDSAPQPTPAGEITASAAVHDQRAA